MAEVVNGGKPKLEQIGPYVFETYSKVLNATFFDDLYGREVIQYKRVLLSISVSCHHALSFGGVFMFCKHQWNWNKYDAKMSTATHPYETATICWPNSAFWGVWAANVSAGK